jgi:hypothetical protein
VELPRRVRKGRVMRTSASLVERAGLELRLLERA